jgi:hypothetical protein
VFFHRRLDVFVQQSSTPMRPQRLGRRGGPFLLGGLPVRLVLAEPGTLRGGVTGLAARLDLCNFLHTLAAAIADLPLDGLGDGDPLGRGEVLADLILVVFPGEDAGYVHDPGQDGLLLEGVPDGPNVALTEDEFEPVRHADGLDQPLPAVAGCESSMGCEKYTEPQTMGSIKNGSLVIIPCGKRKIWEKHPKTGPTQAQLAYTGSPFSLNKTYAKKFGEAWVILSAKYGFMEPTFSIPGNYNVTFNDKDTGPISSAELSQQVRQRQLDGYTVVIGLGGNEYQRAIEEAFANTPVQLKFPFSGFDMIQMMKRTKKAIEVNNPF